ncbi:hypothetical protein BT63DRAFT_480333 [Microthyrium microscopicum]|uniref:Luciferase domain-containing protein n=1 Tax=Microthyrium microscopicum TaxID=703497 RepID=A0A6A6U4Z5_9PEZI|nr:hypothetical protein BT63DRAFT_480333 [Microthyrium microscopicum]
MSKAAITTLVLGTITSVYLYKDYQTYMSMGPGGIPHNAVGWAIASLLKPVAFGKDVLSTKLYEASEEPSFLPENFPPNREGVRPAIGPHPIPHRQLDQLPSDEIKAALIQKYDSIGQKAESASAVYISMSHLEKHTTALYTKASQNTASAMAQSDALDTKGEFAHVHSTGDHSVHVILSPTDCKKVMDAGWGERHTFDGSAFVRAALKKPLPMTYLLIYAPRTEEEVETVSKILEASVTYMTGWNAEK